MKVAKWSVTAGVLAVVAYGLVLSGGREPGIGQTVAVAEQTQVTLETLSIDGAADHRESVVGNGGRLVLVGGFSARTTAADPVILARLERRTGGGDWVDTGALARREADGPLFVTTPAHAAEGATEVVQYRLATATSTSNAIEIRYENQAHYSGVAAEIYGYASAYCPQTAVHVEDLPTNRAGDFGTGGLLIRVSDEVGSSTDLDPEERRALALHECAHERQWLNWGGTSDGRAEMSRATDAIFTDGMSRGSPIEHAADCAAEALGPAGHLGYGGTCSDEQLGHGERLLLGQRY